MSRMMILTPAAAILLVLAAGCSDQPPPAPRAATDVQVGPGPPKDGKGGRSAKEDVRAPGPPTTMVPD